MLFDKFGFRYPVTILLTWLILLQNLTATMPASSPITANGGTSDSEQHLQDFEGHAVKYVEHSLRAM